ncbi:MAG: L-fucose:H+ symporter permease [Bacteroidales bacterium]|jgi:FHS family L-fucose permease-like MFS transporter|nr:L-fucose:H+ symporter permease [Bacteroidales bacterium]
MTEKNTKKSSLLIGADGTSYVIPFILITFCFALWGFANDITNPMVKAFSDILMMSNFEGAMVQMAFYGGYFVMAFPAAIYIKKFSYKSGILMGLGLYALGALLFFPASKMMMFWPYLMAYFIMTCGLSFLETSANPYILSMGTEETSTRRLNFAQSFNPIGSILGMLVAQRMILANLHAASAAERAQMSPEELHNVTAADLSTISYPYILLSLIIIAVFLVIYFAKMPKKQDQDHTITVGQTLKRLIKNKRYYEGVIAQFFYVGVQIMCWTFIIHYATMELGMDAKTAQGYNIVAMLIFICSRFISTYLMKYLTPGKMLMMFAIAGGVFTLGTIFIKGMTGLYCLVGISACMSLMFPTIYGIALRGLGDDAKFGAAGLIMAILGGSVMPPLQGAIIDMGTIFSMPAVRISFFLPFICFIVIGIYGYRAFKVFVK